MRGVKNIWILALGGLKIFSIFFEGVEKSPRCLNKTFYIKCRGGQNISILLVRGVKNISVALRGGFKIVAILF